MNFLERPALRGFRITERRAQASGNDQAVTSRTEVTETPFRWPLRFPIAALLLFAAAAKVVVVRARLAVDGTIHFLHCFPIHCHSRSFRSELALRWSVSVMTATASDASRD